MYKILDFGGRIFTDKKRGITSNIDCSSVGNNSLLVSTAFSSIQKHARDLPNTEENTVLA